VYRQASANTCRYDSSGGKTGLLVEEGDTNEVLYSSENNAAWVVSNATKSATGTSVISGKTPIRVTALGGSGYIEQTVAGLGGGDEYNYIIIESGNNTIADLEHAGISRVRLTFATGAVTQVSGASTYKGAYRVTPNGPNGGEVWILYHSITTGGAANLRYYPDPTGSDKFGYLHHCQGSYNDIHGTSPIVTQGVAVQREAEVITSSTVPSWWSDTEATVIASVERIFSNSETGVIFASSDASPDNYFLCSIGGAPPNSAILVVSIGGVSYSAAATDNITAGTISKAAFSHADGETYAAGNGDVSANAEQVGVPADASRFDIGQALGALYWLNGRIFNLKIVPKALNSTDLDARTT
jgi:hypothetical protein